MNHDEINQRIQALESGLAGLKAELTKSEKFEFDYSNGKSFRVYAEQIDKNPDISISKIGKENFRYRQTELNAKADLQLQKELMCIGAIAEQIDPDYKFRVIWDTTTCNFHIYFNNKMKRYELTYSNVMQTIGVVHMPKNVAEKVCEILNNKQVEL